MPENHTEEAIITTAGSIEHADETFDQTLSNQATEGRSTTGSEQLLVNVFHDREEPGKAELDSQASVTREPDAEVGQGARLVDMESSWTHLDTKVEDSKGQIKWLRKEHYEICRTILSLKQKLRCQKEEIERAENERQKRLCEIAESENSLQQQLDASKNDLQNIGKQRQREKEKQAKWENSLREQLKENEKAIQGVQEEKLREEGRWRTRKTVLYREESDAQIRITELQQRRLREQSKYAEKLKILQSQLEERRRVLNEIQDVKN